MAPPPPLRDLPSRLPRQARPEASYPCLPSSSSANRGKTPGRQTGPPPRPPPRGPPRPTPLAIPSGSSRVARGGLEGPGGGGGLRWPTCRGTNPVSRGSGKGWGRGVAKSMDGHCEHTKGSPLESGVAGGSWGEVGPQGEVPVSVVRHREEKAGDPARGGELVLGVGFASPLPFLPLGQGWTEGVGARWGSHKKSFRSLPSSKSTRLAKRLSERPRL
jgi:hypothetical protein